MAQSWSLFTTPLGKEPDMKPVAKIAIPLIAFASPVVSHDSGHMHPHGSEGWVIGCLVISLALVAIGLKTRRAKLAEQTS